MKDAPVRVRFVAMLSPHSRPAVRQPEEEIMTFIKGDRVNTPLGPGGVAYQRMAPPTYSAAEAVSVVLDARRGDPTYTGTIFAAADVTKVQP